MKLRDGGSGVLVGRPADRNVVQALDAALRRDATVRDDQPPLTAQRSASESVREPALWPNVPNLLVLIKVSAGDLSKTAR
jgi:hypothetical protein